MKKILGKKWDEVKPELFKTARKFDMTYWGCREYGCDCQEYEPDESEGE